MRHLHRDYIVLLARIVKRGGSILKKQLVKTERINMQRLVRWKLVDQAGDTFIINEQGKEWAEKYEPNPNLNNEPPEFIP